MTTRYCKEDYSRISDQIREAVTIPALWQKLYGVALRQRNACRCPWRKDEHPSFWISRDGKAWLDRVTGDKGNVFNFYIKAMDCDQRQAFVDLLAMAGGNEGIGSAPIRAEPVTAAPKRRQFHPKLRVPSSDELAAISGLRSIAIEALRLAVGRGFLWTAEVRGIQAFVVTDRTRKAYSARQINGEPWDDGAKAIFLPGSRANWPIGCTEAKDYPCSAFCEGAMDLLAAFGHAWASGVEDRIAPVCLATGAVGIIEEALPYFIGKRVRIFAHNDAAGQTAFERWAGQLDGIVATVDRFDFTGLIQTDGNPVNDLNDLLRIDYDCWELNRDRGEGVMNFAPEVR